MTKTGGHLAQPGNWGPFSARRAKVLIRARAVNGDGGLKPRRRVQNAQITTHFILQVFYNHRVHCVANTLQGRTQNTVLNAPGHPVS
jgi:hypothetical protein